MRKEILVFVLLLLGCQSRLEPPWLDRTQTVRVRAQAGGAVLDWSEADQATFYRVYAARDPNVSPDTPGVLRNDEGDRDTRFRELDPGTDYYFIVVPEDSSGREYPPTAPVSITPLPYGLFGDGPSLAWDASLGVNGASTAFGGSVQSGGDIDGDGDVELVVGEEGFNRVHVFPGGPLEFSTTPDQMNGTGQFGDALSSGDLDDDNRTDILVAAPVEDTPAIDAGSVSLFRGTANGIETTPAAIIYGSQENSRLGWSLAVGDFDGDDRDDVLAGAPGINAAYTFALDDSGAAFTTPNDLGIPIGNGGIGWAVAAGSFDGGFDDAAVSASGTPGTIHVFQGLAGGLVPVATEPISIPVLTADVEMATGDVDGNNRDELVVGDRQTNAGAGFVEVFLGPAIQSPPDFHYDGKTVGDEFGESLAIGDVNGDGYGDLVVGAPSAADGGRLYVFSGGPTGLEEEPAWVFLGSSQGLVAVGDELALLDMNGDGALEIAAGDTDYIDTNANPNTFGRVAVLMNEPAIGPDLQVSAELVGPNLVAIQVLRYVPLVNGEAFCIVEFGNEHVVFPPCDELNSVERTLSSGPHDIRVTIQAPNGATTRIVTGVQVP